MANNALSIITKALADSTENMPTSIKVAGKEINSKPMVSMYTKSAVLLAAKKISEKALCIECARLTLEDVKQYGFKSVADFAVQAFAKDVTAGQINDYVRVGKIFGNLKGTGYSWKKGIPQAVTMTNLRQVMGLVFEECKDKESKDVTKLSETDLNKLFDRFVSLYIEGESKYVDPKKPCPLQASNGVLREWLADLKKAKEAIPTTATPIPDNGKPADNADQQTDQQADQQADYTKEQTACDNMKMALADFMAVYADDEDVEKMCSDLLALVMAKAEQADQQAEQADQQADQQAE